MSRMTRAGLLAGAAALTLTGVSAASTTTDGKTDDQVIRELQARVAELEAKQGGKDTWLTEQRAAEIRSLVQDVLADADTRASLLSSGMVSGYDNGFQIGDQAGNFLLQINGQLQARWMYNRQRNEVDQLEHPGTPPILSDTAGGAALAETLGFFPFFFHDGDRNRSGFENTRTKLWFSGHILNPSWRYLVEADFGQLGGFTLLDAWIAHEYGDTGLIATIGQFKLPFLREELVDSRYQQTVERSLVNSYFSAGRSSGIMVGWEQDMFRIFGALSDGAHNLNTASIDYTTEYALTARGEFLFAGTWGQFNELRSPHGEEFGLLVGGAMHWERDEHGVLNAAITERFRATVDATAKFGGWNLFGAYILDYADNKGNGNFTNHAVMAQGGFHFTDEWEVFGRYEHVFWDSDTKDAFGIQDLSLLTAGVNHYMFQGGHSAKWTTDFGYAFNRVPLGDARTGWRADGSVGGKNQFVIRTQLQLAF